MNARTATQYVFRDSPQHQCKSQGFKDKFRTLKGFLAREFKKDLGTNNIKEIEIDENNEESSFVVALKVDKKNILNFLKKDISRNFLYLITWYIGSARMTGTKNNYLNYYNGR